MTEADAGIESLYPFLYGGAADEAGVFDEACRSTEAKAVEISALRQEVALTCDDELHRCASAMAARFDAGGRLFTFGNGGSSSDAQAVAQLFCAPGDGWKPLPAVSLTNDVAVLTALANDVGFDVVFARPLAASAAETDIAMGLSTSGGSTNVLNGFAEARRIGMLTVGFAGYDGGVMAKSGDIDHVFVVPSSSVHRIQEAQTTLYDMLWELVQRALG